MEVINTHDILFFYGNDIAEAESSFHAVVVEYIDELKADRIQPYIQGAVLQAQLITQVSKYGRKKTTENFPLFRLRSRS